MQAKFLWKKGIFSSTYNIFFNEQQIGKLKDKLFSQSSVGEINGKEYTFKTKGFFKQHTEIFDIQTNQPIGEISYNNWMNKAIITIQEKTANWKYKNIWNTKWEVTNKEGLKINYTGSSTKGKIESNTENDLLLLSGLFITNYYWQITIVILASQIPIWVSVFN